MKIRYQFVNEHVEVDVDEKWGDILLDLDRQEYNTNQKEKRRHVSLSALSYDGNFFATKDYALAALFTDESEEGNLRTALSLLSLKQQEMVKAIYFEGISVKEYAARKGVDHSAISHRLKTLKNNLKKLYKNPHI